MKMNKQILSIFITSIVFTCLGLTFNKIPLGSETFKQDDPLGVKQISNIVDQVSTFQQNVSYSTNTQTLIIRTCDTNFSNSVEQINEYVNRKHIDGITLDAPFGSINLFTDEDDNQYKKVFINGLNLEQIIAKELKNPLFGKKLAIIGDSQSCTPNKETCYAGLIAKRNNMQYVNNGVGGTKLNLSVDSPSGGTYPAIIDSYLNDIPMDSDFILIQAGYNGSFDEGVDDESLDKSTFKGCWNIILSSIKTTFPNSTCGIMLPYSWITTKVDRVEWMKTRCDKYGFEYFDQTKLFTTNQVQYFEEGKAFGVHLSTLGARKVSYPIEDWMKKTMNIYNNNLYK